MARHRILVNSDRNSVAEDSFPVLKTCALDNALVYIIDLTCEGNWLNFEIRLFCIYCSVASQLHETFLKIVLLSSFFCSDLFEFS